MSWGSVLDSSLLRRAAKVKEKPAPHWRHNGIYESSSMEASGWAYHGTAVWCKMCSQFHTGEAAHAASKGDRCQKESALQDLRDLEDIRRSLGARVLVTDQEQLVLAGRCLAGYARRFGEVRPRDHLVDAVVATAAALSKAILVTENLADMARWRDELGRLKRRLVLQGSPE